MEEARLGPSGTVAIQLDLERLKKGVGRRAHQEVMGGLGEDGVHRRQRILGGKDADEDLESLQLWAFQHARLDEDGEGDEAQLLECSA
jgi:hypothetical protein